MIEVIDDIRDMAHAGREVRMPTGRIEVVFLVNGYFVDLFTVDTENETDAMAAARNAMKPFGTVPDTAEPSELVRQLQRKP